MNRSPGKFKAILLSLLLCCVMLLDAPAALAGMDYDDDGYFDDDDFYDDGDYQDDQGYEPEPPPPTRPSADDIDAQFQPKINSINDKLASLAMEKTQIEQSISSAQTEREREQANKTYIDRQIQITIAEIELLLERIEILEAEIVAKIARIEEKQREYDKNYAHFLVRLRNMQLNGDITQLGAILGADSFANYLATNEMMARVAAYDQRLMERVREEHRALEQEKANLEEALAMVEADRVETEDKRRELSVQQQSAVLKIQSLADMEAQFRADLAANQRLSREAQEELARVFAEIEYLKNPYVGGEMGWPVPGFSRISSYFGWRFGGSDYHTGIDIYGSNIHGKPVVAANHGTVARVNHSYSPGRGYGIFVIIDHGGKVTTLYAHLSSISVTQGQEVRRGDEIGRIGSTGWSTGPHLHFEIRENGTAKDPLPYLKS